MICNISTKNYSGNLYSLNIVLVSRLSLLVVFVLLVEALILNAIDHGVVISTLKGVYS